MTCDIRVQAVLVFIGLAFSGVRAEDAFFLNGDAAAGQITYQTYCMPCHGEKGDGNGPAGAVLDPKPRDYTDYEAMSKLTDQYLFTVVKEGGLSVGKSPLMAAWKSALNDQQIRDVVAFVKTFAKKPE